MKQIHVIGKRANPITFIDGQFEEFLSERCQQLGAPYMQLARCVSLANECDGITFSDINFESYSEEFKTVVFVTTVDSKPIGTDNTLDTFISINIGSTDIVILTVGQTLIKHSTKYKEEDRHTHMKGNAFMLDQYNESKLFKMIGEYIRLGKWKKLISTMKYWYDFTDNQEHCSRYFDKAFEKAYNDEIQQRLAELKEKYRG